MSSQLGTLSQPLRVAIIGAGPAGFYIADALLKQKDLKTQIDIFERLPAPYGLVRYGVAPDHQKIKSVTKLYDRTLDKPQIRFFGNVNFGTDLTKRELQSYYDQIVYAVGAQSDRHLNIPGEDLAGVLSATEFVAWYNGHPDYCHLEPDLNGENAVVIGAGNVALDVARILARSIDELSQTDVADHALEQLAHSNINRISIIGRRGPAQTKFTLPELRELVHLEAADVIVNPADLELDASSTRQVQEDKAIQRNLEQFHLFTERPLQNKEKQIHFRFLASPVELTGTEGRVSEMRIEQNRLEETEDGYLQSVGTGENETIPVDLVLRSVGYRGVALPDVSFDERRGTIPNENGRVLDSQTGTPMPGEYVVGWAKRGPSGVIGTNRADSIGTVRQMLADLPDTQPATERESLAIERLLNSRGIRYINVADWRRIDEWERAMGQEYDRPRIKTTSLKQVLELLNGNAND